MRGIDFRQPGAPLADDASLAGGNEGSQTHGVRDDASPQGAGRAPGAEGIHGDELALAGGCEPGCGPRFDAPVMPEGYLWWYVDAFSDDRRHGITLIAQVGSCFSPYYAWARRRGDSDPLNHNSLNVALYGACKRWSMTERGRSALRRDASRLEIGPSALSWDGTCLTIRIEEIAVPIPRRIRGTVKLYPRTVAGQPYFLDGAGRHRWAPIAPGARVEVQLDQPALSWAGHGYLDSNWGSEPLEKAFRYWEWSRAELKDGGTAVLYDAARRDGHRTELGLHFDPAGDVERIDVPPHATLPTTAWLMQRGTRVDPQQTARVTETLENTPFYTRSVLETHLLGEPVTAMHESVCLDRFDSRWVQVLLPFRIPRALR
ncbi:carotenoid 1,2-hydratase [Thiocystis violascens]|uniref:Hydroxyneurosporene synthase n=1 Tax=Thiocystis violascens (strain ATCC 17096 / DSM 198 / 6111) TaxID=765911 RepID=I3YAF5_THIV6|nr:carotenoid 1,2-hydratase [Thiocystis violascens]AFL73973.1 hydroxyneurosporene synthase [Thiocystis violascens DSM 198]